MAGSRLSVIGLNRGQRGAFSLPNPSPFSTDGINGSMKEKTTWASASAPGLRPVTAPAVTVSTSNRYRRATRSAPALNSTVLRETGEGAQTQEAFLTAHRRNKVPQRDGWTPFGDRRQTVRRFAIHFVRCGAAEPEHRRDRAAAHTSAENPARLTTGMERESSVSPETLR